MPRFLAIEWDDHQIRTLVATTSGRSMTVERTGAIDLPTEEGKAPPPAMIGKALSDWFRQEGISRCATLVAVGRASIELRRFTLPPAPDAELPEMVRFQAQREFSSLTEESPLDFLPLAGDDKTPRQVLAAALSPDLLAQIRSVCDAAGLRAERIVLRPCATAAVVRQAAKADVEGASLIIDPLLDEVDLSVLVDQKVAFIRTCRLPHVAEDERQYKPLLGELRRTIAAFHNQFREVRISSITICGDPANRAALAEAVEKEFELPTSVLHPLDSVDGTSHFKKNMPEHPGRFAPLVGMVLDEATGSHAIDFLNPRKKPQEKTNRLTYALAAAAVLMAIGWYGWWQYDRIAEQRLTVQMLEEQIAKEKEFYKDAKLEAIESRAANITAWLQSDVPWLDEIRELSLALRPIPLDNHDEFPVDEDVVATSLTATGGLDGGRIKFDVAAKKNDLAMTIERRIREGDEKDRLMAETFVDNEETRPGYPWTFPATEHIQKEE